MSGAGVIVTAAAVQRRRVLRVDGTGVRQTDRQQDKQQGRGTGRKSKTFEKRETGGGASERASGRSLSEENDDEEGGAAGQ